MGLGEELDEAWLGILWRLWFCLGAGVQKQVVSLVSKMTVGCMCAAPVPRGEMFAQNANYNFHGATGQRQWLGADVV